MVSPQRDAPLYQQVAALLRAQIADGTLQPGAELRSEPDLCHDYSVGRKTIRDALQVLRGEGLIVTRRGYRIRVRDLPEVTQIRVPAGTVVSARMPTPEERQRLDLSLGIPVLLVGSKLYPADRFVIVAE